MSGKTKTLEDAIEAAEAALMGGAKFVGMPAWAVRLLKERAEESIHPAVVSSGGES